MVVAVGANKGRLGQAVHTRRAGCVDSDLVDAAAGAVQKHIRGHKTLLFDLAARLEIVMELSQ